MPLCNFLAVNLHCANARSELRPGDLVFRITYRTNSGQLTPNHFAHAGIVAVELPDYRLGMNVQVLHMGPNFVALEQWQSEQLSVEAAGTMNELDPLVRQHIIDKALEYIQLTPSLIRQGILNCYLMGEARPKLPGASAYGFSCATFAHHCYAESLPASIGGLVALEKMPFTTQSEYQYLSERFSDGRLIGHLQPFPFRRLYPGYLMGAFYLDEYPFDPDDWEEWKDHGRFIPDELLDSDST